MKHCYWTYVGDVGVSQKVGLLHGQKTGHLIIYCGKKILIVDFKVRDSKTYSFFINDELCEVILTRKGDTMHYSFRIDKETDTPRNRARKKLERKYNLQTFLFFGGLFLTLFLLFSLVNHSKNDHQELASIVHTQEAIGQVEIEYQNEKPAALTYHFVVHNAGYSVESEISDTTILLAPSGMPIESGDEFYVKFTPDNPANNKIDYSKPTKKQLTTYRNRVVEKHLRLNPELPKYLVQCIVDAVFELKGLNGFATLYFQDFSPEQNPQNNNQSYLKLTRDIPYQEKIQKACW